MSQLLSLLIVIATRWDATNVTARALTAGRRGGRHYCHCSLTLPHAGRHLSQLSLCRDCWASHSGCRCCRLQWWVEYMNLSSGLYTDLAQVGNFNRRVTGAHSRELLTALYTISLLLIHK